MRRLLPEIVAGPVAGPDSGALIHGIGRSGFRRRHRRFPPEGGRGDEACPLRAILPAHRQSGGRRGRARRGDGEMGRRIRGLTAQSRPAKLAGDGAFAKDDLKAVAEDALSAALNAVDSDDRDAAAANHLKPVAGRLTALRKRNGLWIYSDCIAAMNRAMDGAWVYRRKPPDFGDTAQVAEMDKRFRRAGSTGTSAASARPGPRERGQSGLQAPVRRQPRFDPPADPCREGQERAPRRQQPARAALLRPADLAAPGIAADVPALRYAAYDGDSG